MEGYTSYQHLQFGWTDALPSHWGVKRLKRVLSERKENNNPVKTNEILSLTNTRGVIPYSEKGNIGNKSKENIEGYHLTYPNDLVVNSMNVVIGSVGVSDYFGAISPVYYALMSRGEANIKYYEYIFRLPSFEETLKGLGNGILEIRMRIPMSKLNNVLLPLPPRVEQDQIVRFLDWKVSAINKLIGIRRKEIQELEEMKRSKIGAIVMGQSRMQQKKSDITWVDTIPINWEEKPLIQYAYERCIKNVGMVEDNLLSLSYGKVIDKDINTTDGLLPASFEGYQIVEPGNIILRLTDLQNDHKSLRTGLVTRRGIITSAYTCLETRDDILPEYLQLELHVADLCKVFYGMGGGVRQSIGFKDIKRMIIAIPPLSEQHEILDLIHDIDAPIDKQKEQYLKIINELEELKKVIISDVVTGKIDVQNVTVPEYEHVDDIADIDSEGDEETDESEIYGEED
jgi:type I restriction enzyme S subunit